MATVDSSDMVVVAEFGVPLIVSICILSEHACDLRELARGSWIRRWRREVDQSGRIGCHREMLCVWSLNRVGGKSQAGMVAVQLAL
jgi:hypothetical protein